MSAGLSDQRMKGQGNQVTNGPKDHLNEQEEFDTWRAQHQNYTAQVSSNMASDHFMPSYYGTSYPYQAYGVGDGTWSNSDPMTFLSGYGGQMNHDSYGMEGVFGGGFGNVGAPAAAGYNFFHGNGDYSTWGPGSAALSAPPVAPPAPRKPHFEEHTYYRHHDNPYQGVNSVGEGVKGAEAGLQALALGEKVLEAKETVAPVQREPPQAKTWASIASQPAKAQVPLAPHHIKKKGPGMPPPPMVPGKHNMDIGTWEGKNGGGGAGCIPKVGVAAPGAVRGGWGGAVRAPGPPAPQGALPPAHYRHPVPTPQACPPHIPHPPHHHHPMHQTSSQQLHHVNPSLQSTSVLEHQQQQQQQVQQRVNQIPGDSPSPEPSSQSHPILDKLRLKNNYNPTEFDLNAEGARFFVIKSYSEDDIHRSIKYEIWCSTEHGNKRLDLAFREREGKPKGSVYLFFSVNGSGHFCGMARMMSPVDYDSTSSVWSQDKWKGQFKVRWIYVKDIPNGQLRHIRLENNENKPVTNSRDTQEVPLERGRQVLRVMHSFKHSTSIFDDFIHYEKRQEEEDTKKQAAAVTAASELNDHSPQPQHPPSHPHHKDRGDGRSRGGRFTNFTRHH